MPIRELTHGTDCDLVLLVQQVERRPRKSGEDFLKVVFSDRTGSLPANVWDDVDTIESLLVVGAPFRVYGKYEVHEKFGGQLRLEGFAPAEEGSFDASDLRAGPPVPVPELERRLRVLIDTVTDPQMRAVLDAVLGEGTPTWEAFRIAPAAKRVHQAYRHGLLEHCLTVGEAVSGAAGVFPGIDRDLAVTAALIHDIGKLDAYAFGEGDVVDLTDAGKLRGEIVIGYERMHGVLDRIPGITEKRKQAFLHIILAHHGKLEHGSPVTPQTREALLVHTMDNLGGKLGTSDRLEQERQPGSAWSKYDGAFGSAVWFESEAEEPPAPVPHVGGPLAHEHAPGHPPAVPAEAAPSREEPPSGGAAVAPVGIPPAVVPRAAFEDTDAWRPPSPDELVAPPVPGELLTEPPVSDVIPADERPEPPHYREARDEPSPVDRAADRDEAFATPGRVTPERAEDDLATSRGDQRRGGPPPPPDAQPLPF